MKISFYKSLFDKDSDETTISDFLNSVKFGKWQDAVFAIRNTKTEAEQKELKKKLPSVMVSGLFYEPKDNACQQHSGFIAIDFDEMNDLSEFTTAREVLKNDRYTYAVATSVRGNGMFVLVRIDGAKHRESFNQLANYYRATYNLIVDPHCINEARRRFVSYDPELYINEKAAKFVAKVEKKEKPPKPFIAIKSNADRIVRELIDGGHNICEDYNDWIKVGMALKNEYSDAGLTMWVALSRASSKYKDGQCERKWPTFRGSSVSFATVAWMASQNGIETKDQRTKDIERFVIAQGKTRDEGSEKAAKVMGIEPLTNEEWEAVGKIPEGMAPVSDKVSKIVTAKVWIEKNTTLWRCELTNKVYNGKQELNDAVINSLWIALAKAGIDVTVNNVWALCTENGLTEKNEIKDFLSENEDKGHDLITELIESITFKHNDISKALCLTWLVSTLETLFNRPLPYMMVFTGKQNSGKTEFFRRLLPDDLKHWLAESTLDQGKDSEKLMCEHWFILNDEYKGSTLKDVAKLKDLLSKNYFTLRPPYGKSNMQFRRIATLCGTSNENSLIYDHTGNRRIFPLEVISIDFARMNNINRVKLWGQIYHAWKNNIFELILSKDLLEKLSELSDENTEFTILYHVLNDQYEDSKSHWTSVINIHTLMSDLLKKERISTTAIGIEAKRLGWEKSRRKVNGKLQMGYNVTRTGHQQKDDNLPY
jgi:hypothetical protein